jgi:hypothetical protein
MTAAAILDGFCLYIMYRGSLSSFNNMKIFFVTVSTKITTMCVDGVNNIINMKRSHSCYLFSLGVSRFSQIEISKRRICLSTNARVFLPSRQRNDRALVSTLLYASNGFLSHKYIDIYNHNDITQTVSI